MYAFWPSCGLSKSIYPFNALLNVFEKPSNNELEESLNKLDALQGRIEALCKHSYRGRRVDCCHDSAQIKIVRQTEGKDLLRLENVLRIFAYTNKLREVLEAINDNENTIGKVPSQHDATHLNGALKEILDEIKTKAIGEVKDTNISLPTQVAKILRTLSAATGMLSIAYGSILLSASTVLTVLITWHHMAIALVVSVLSLGLLLLKWADYQENKIVKQSFEYERNVGINKAFTDIVETLRQLPQIQNKNTFDPLSQMTSWNVAVGSFYKEIRSANKDDQPINLIKVLNVKALNAAKERFNPQWYELLSLEEEKVKACLDPNNRYAELQKPELWVQADRNYHRLKAELEGISNKDSQALSTALKEAKKKARNNLNPKPSDNNNRGLGLNNRVPELFVSNMA